MPEILHAIRQYAWLIIVGLVVAAVAGLSAAYHIVDGSLEPRSTAVYSTESTVLLTSPRVPPYRAVIPGQSLSANETPATTNDLSRSALVYAYIVNGSEFRSIVESRVGELEPTVESLTAVQRTTQPTDEEPTGDVAGQTRFSPPILALRASATTADRSLEIATAGVAALQDSVVAQQDAAALTPEQRVTLDALGSETVQVTSGSALIPGLVTGAAVFVAFLALIVALRNARAARLRHGVRAAPAHSEDQGASL